MNNNRRKYILKTKKNLNATTRQSNNVAKRQVVFSGLSKLAHIEGYTKTSKQAKVVRTISSFISTLRNKICKKG